MHILKELVGPELFSTFLSEHLRKKPFARPYMAKHFEDLISWKDLRDMICVHKNSWLPLRGKLPEDIGLNQGKLTYTQAKENFSLGRTILLRHAEESHIKVKYIADSFKNFFNSPVDVQLYVTPKGNEGFDWHYDVEDVFIIQSSGEKEYRLIENTTAPRPLPIEGNQSSYFIKEKNDTEIRCNLCAGDWLYIPAGYWHKACAVTDSIHLSVGVLLQEHS